MSNAKTYRQRAADCLTLAKSAEEFYVRTALLELAQDLNNTANELERGKQPLNTRSRARGSQGRADRTTSVPWLD